MALTSRLLLLDTSVLARDAHRDARFDRDELCLCAITKMELLFSARSAEDFEAIELRLSAFRELRIDAETVATATTAQRDLARLGRHHLPLPDLLIASCAHQHGADVLHLDRHFDVLADVLTFGAIRL